MPALTNIKVGSLCGTSGADGTRAWPAFSKKSRKPRRMSLVDVIADDVCEGVRPGKRRWVQAGAPSGRFSAPKCGDEVDAFPISVQAYFPGHREIGRAHV